MQSNVNLTRVFNAEDRDTEESQAINRTDFDDDQWDENDQYIPPNNTAGQLFKLNDSYVSLQQHYHYAYHGESLKFLCLKEYPNIIQVVSINTRKINQRNEHTSTPSQHAECEDVRDANDDNLDFIDPKNYHNARFRFDKRHVLYETHTQMIKSTFSIPIMAGKHSSTLPLPCHWDDPKYLQKGKECAEYYITLLVPWDTDLLAPTKYSFDFNGFHKMCTDMKSTYASFIDKCKYTSINIMAASSRNSTFKRNLLNKYRFRAAKQWKEGNKGASNEGGSEIDERDREIDAMYDEIMGDDLATEIISNAYKKDKSQEKAMAYISNQRNALSKLYGFITERNINTTQTSVANTVYDNGSDWISNSSIENVESVIIRRG